MCTLYCHCNYCTWNKHSFRLFGIACAYVFYSVQVYFVQVQYYTESDLIFVSCINISLWQVMCHMDVFLVTIHNMSKEKMSESISINRL
jgi:hypothetical protein